MQTSGVTQPCTYRYAHVKHAVPSYRIKWNPFYRKGTAEVKILTMPGGIYSGRKMTDWHNHIHVCGPSRWNCQFPIQISEHFNFPCVPSFYSPSFSPLFLKKKKKIILLLHLVTTMLLNDVSEEEGEKQMQSRTHLISCASRYNVLPKRSEWLAEMLGWYSFIRSSARSRWISQLIYSLIKVLKEWSY